MSPGLRADFTAKDGAQESWLRAQRDQQGLSRRELAARLGVREETVRAWEIGENLPRRGLREQLAEHLGTDVAVLCQRLGLPPPSERPKLAVVPIAEGVARPAAPEVRTRLLEALLDGLASGAAAQPSWVEVARAAFALAGEPWPE